MTPNTLLQPPAEASPAGAKRRWFRPQFGLRGLLVVVLVTGAVAGILSRRIARANRQRQVVNELLTAGFTVQYDHGVRRIEVPGKSAPDRDYFWQRIDFLHNVVQLQSVYFGSRSPETMALLAELPDLEKIEVLYAVDETVAPLPRMACRSRLKLLKLLSPPLQPGDADRIGECLALTSLEVRVDDAVSGELAALDHLRDLQSLRIEGPIVEKTVAAWQQLSRLEVLQLSDVRNVTPQSLAAVISRNPRLRRLDLGKANCTTEVCEALAQCESLAQLRLSGAQLDDEGLTKLRSLKQLAGLDITETQVRGTAFDGIDSFPRLSQLRAERSLIDDQGAFLLARIPQLRSLDLSGTQVTDAACEHLSRYDLVTLNLAKNNITDQGINSLHCERLAKLNLADTAVSPQAFASASQWPNLEVLVLGKPADSEAELERVLLIPTLRKFYGDGPVDDIFLARYAKRFVHLQTSTWPKDWTD